METGTNRQLSAPMFEILLSLAGGDMHGYGIMKEVEERTGGAVRMGPTSLYRSLKKLLQMGYIKEMEGLPGEAGDERRRVYCLLDRGREAATRRADALARTVEDARQRGLLPGEGTS